VTSYLIEETFPVEAKGIRIVRGSYLLDQKEHDLLDQKEHDLVSNNPATQRAALTVHTGLRYKIENKEYFYEPPYGMREPIAYEIGENGELTFNGDSEFITPTGFIISGYSNKQGEFLKVVRGKNGSVILVRYDEKNDFPVENKTNLKSIFEEWSRVHVAYDRNRIKVIKIPVEGGEASIVLKIDSGEVVFNYPLRNPIILSALRLEEIEEKSKIEDVFEEFIPQIKKAYLEYVKADRGSFILQNALGVDIKNPVFEPFGLFPLASGFFHQGLNEYISKLESTDEYTKHCEWLEFYKKFTKLKILLSLKQSGFGRGINSIEQRKDILTIFEIEDEKNYETACNAILNELLESINNTKVKHSLTILKAHNQG
jgi:hypothetical protein